VTITLRRELRRIYDAAIAAAAPGPLIGRAFEGLTPGSEIVGDLFEQARRILIVAAGKASIPMTRELVRRCGAKLEAAMAAAPADPAAQGFDVREEFAIVRGGHPIPDAGSIRAAQAVLEIAKGASAGDLLIVALSGGASAIVALPSPGIGLEDKNAVTSALMRTSAPIRELNTVRKHLSAIKGGRLAATVNGARVLTLALSDVIGNDLATIGSGPTVGDPTTFAEAVAILKRRKVWGRAPESVRDLLERGVAGEIEETIKPGDPRLQGAATVIIGDNGTAVDGAEREAVALGYRVRRRSSLSGEAEDAGRAAAAELAGIDSPRSCIIAGGEPVVTIHGTGRGGRAQHCALAGAIEMARRGGRIPTDAALLVAGTDGIDGPTDAAGAFADPETIARARAAGLDPQLMLAHNDSYTLFHALDDLFITGPTGTNVGDLLIGIVSG
jgi:glycerate-2-kinase